jgi:hypothetical protein
MFSGVSVIGNPATSASLSKAEAAGLDELDFSPVSNALDLPPAFPSFSVTSTACSEAPYTQEYSSPSAPIYFCFTVC